MAIIPYLPQSLENKTASSTEFWGMKSNFLSMSFKDKLFDPLFENMVTCLLSNTEN